MNILVVSDVSSENIIGGAERVLVEQCRRLARKGHAVHIMTRRLPLHAGRHYGSQAGFHEWRHTADPANPFRFLSDNFRNGRRLFESLHRRYAFDCIHIHQPFSALGVIRSPVGRGIRKVYTVHSLGYEEYASRNRRPADGFGRMVHFFNVQVRKGIEYAVLRQADRIVALSRYTQLKLNRAYRIPGNRVSVLPGGVDLEKFCPAEPKPRLRGQLKIDDDGVVLFTVRNLVPRMGLENLIRAVKHVAKEARDIQLIVGGEGPLRGRLTALVEAMQLKNHVRFEGFIPEAVLSHYYRMADLFVLPTRELEGFGLVTLEAMASGLPAVGTPVGGTAEIIGKFDESFLFKDTSPEAMAELILEKYCIIKKQPHEWEIISLGCREFVENNYSWDKHVDTLEKILAG